MSRDYTAVRIRDEDGESPSSSSPALELMSLTDDHRDDDDPAAAHAHAHARAAAGGSHHHHNSAHSSIAGDETTALVPSDMHEETAGGDDVYQHEEDSEAADASPGKKAPVGGLIVLDANPPTAEEITVTIMQLGGSGLGNTQLNAPREAPIADVIRRVYARELAEHKRIRLVYMGRMLQENETLRSVNVKSGDIVHSLITAALPPADPNDPAAADANANADPLQQAAQNASVLPGADGYPGNGFFSDEQIARMHQQQILDEHNHYIVTTQSREGTSIEFVLGLGLGFVLGFLALLWLLNSSVSRKQRLGILLGLGIRIIVGMDSVVSESQPTDPTPGAALGNGTAIDTGDGGEPVDWFGPGGDPSGNAGGGRDYDPRGIDDFPSASSR